VIADMHCHVDLYPDPVQIARVAAQDNVWVLAVTTTPKAWTGTKQRLSNFRNVEVALGLHPELAHVRGAEISFWESLLPKAPYVGEIGLDGSSQYRDHRQIQLKIFQRILTGCKEAGGKVLTIHSRGAATEVLETLEKSPGCGLAILHWFTGTKSELDAAKRLGCWYSVGPAQLRSTSGAQRVAAMPRSRVVLETDGPFAKYQNRALRPSDVIDAIEVIAGLWGISSDEARSQVECNQEEIWRFAQKS